MPSPTEVAFDRRIIGVALASFPDEDGDLVLSDRFTPDDRNPNTGMRRFVARCEREGHFIPSGQKSPFAVADLLDADGTIIEDRGIPTRAAYDAVLAMLTGV